VHPIFEADNSEKVYTGYRYFLILSTLSIYNGTVPAMIWNIPYRNVG